MLTALGVIIMILAWYVYYHYFLMGSILFFIALTFFASLVLSFAITGFLSYQYLYERLAFMVLIAFFNAFMPVFGLIGISITLFFIKKPPPESDQQDILSVATPDYVPSLESIGLNFGVGGARTQLMDSHAVNAVRRSALLAISAKQSIDSNQMLLEALNDSNDEIRLLAYSLLDLQDQKITKEIEKTALLAEETDNNDKKMMLLKRLANLYYETTYRLLVQADALEQALEKTIETARSVIDFQQKNKLKQSASMWLLIALVNRRKDNDQEAYDAFDQARELGAAESRTLPFLAEIKFKQGQFAEVKSILQQGYSLSNMQKVGPAIRLWKNSDD